MILTLALSLIFWGFSLFAVPMNGVYTIGGTSPDFNTITEAVNALIANGVDGYTDFTIRNGTYNEQVTIPAISGTSSANWIVFRSESGNANDVIILHTAGSSSDNYLVKLDGADYVDFHQLTFRAEGTSNLGIVFQLNNGTTHIKIQNNKLYGTGRSAVYSKLVNASLSGSNSISDIEIQSNYFYDAYYGIFLYAYSSTNINSITSDDNYFDNVMTAIYLEYVPNAEINRNFVDNANEGIYIENCSSAVIRKNRIFVQKTAINVRYSSSAEIINNELISNAAPYSGNYGLGQGIVLNNSNSAEVYYNSVKIDEVASDNSSAAFALYGGISNHVFDNIFANFGRGYSVIFSSVTGSDLDMDYNDIFVGKGYLAKSGNTIYYSLSEFQTGFGENANSVSAYPGFGTDNANATSPWVDDKGTPISGITEDLNGNSRDATNPDIGCDEFTADSAYTTPMSGTYNVGTGYDYENLTEALNELLLRGTNGSVSFNLNNGTYSGNYKLFNIPSASGSNQVTIALGTGNPVLSYAATSDDDDYVFLLMGGTTFYDFSYLTLEATGTQYSRIIEVEGYNRFRIIGGSLTAPQTSSDDRNRDLINTRYAYVKELSLMYVDFSGGSSGIYFSGNSDYDSDIEIYRCDFSDNYQGIYIAYYKSPYIHENTFTNSYYTAVQADGLTENFRITKNKIFKSNTQYGLYLNNCVGGDSTSSRGLIANNVIKLETSTSTGYGISFSYNQKIDILFNSIYQEGETGAGTPFYCYQDYGNNTIKNNIFATECVSNRAMEIVHPSTTTTMDYNDFYSENRYLVKIDNDYINLEDLQNQTGEHLHSVSIYPYFTSDMHSYSPSLNDRGVWISSVSTDFDNQNRTNPPDMGADEYVPASGNSPLNGIYTIGTSRSDYSSFTEAADDLSFRGISGDVTFLVESGVYEERPIFRQYYTTNSTYFVKFQSQTANDEDVTLQYGPTVSDSNYVLILAGADHIRFEDITFTTTYVSNYYNTIMKVRGNTDNLQILSCTFTIADTTNSSERNVHILFDNASYSTASIVNNSFYYGYYGVYDEDENSGLTINYNYFHKTRKPVYLSLVESPTISHNIMDDFTCAIYLNNVDGGTQIYDNKMTSHGFNDYYHGYNLVNLYNCDGLADGHILIYNNILYAYDNYITGLSGFSFNNCQYLDFYHNNVFVENVYDIYITSTRGCAVYASGDNYDVKNNILAYYGNGHAFELQPGSNVNYDLDYNDLYNEGLFLAKIGQDNFKTVEEIRDNSDFSDHSVKAPPLPDSDLFTTSAFLVGKGIYNHQFAYDYNNTERNDPPVIGATEYSPSSTNVLSGSYSIGTGRTDYATIQAAITDLLSRGVGNNDVTFNIESGTYNEQLELYHIPHTIDSNAGVTFQSQSGNANDVNITFDATSDSNYIFKLAGVNNLNINALKFTPLNSSYNKILLIKGYNTDLTISECILEGETNADYNNGTLVKFDIASFENVAFNENEFNNGGYGIYYSNYDYPQYADNLRMENNSFSSNYQALYLKSISNLFIEENDIDNQTSTALYAENIDDSLLIYRNKMKAKGSYVMKLYDYHGISGNSGLIANNFFYKFTTNYGYYNVYLQDVNYLDFYLNSVNTMDVNNVKSFYLVGPNSNLNIRDNIFSQKSGGCAIYVTNDTGLLNMEYNLLYTTGSYLAYWEGTYCSDLAELMSVSGYNNASINGDPGFVNDSEPDLDSSSLAINGAFYIASITEDIYGTHRTEPFDIGAYEFVGAPAIPQNITIEIINGDTARISWSVSANATSYRVENSDDPYTGFSAVTTTTNTTVDIPISTIKKFYRVIALN